MNRVHRSRRALIDFSIAILVMVGVVVTAASLWFRNAVYGDRTFPAQQTNVVIPRGATFGEIVTVLDKKGVLAHPFAFRILARMRRDEAGVKAGEYRFAPHETSDDILRKLVAGEAQVAVWVTVPEGYTAREIARTLAEHKLGGRTVLERTFLHEGLEFNGRRTPSLEGYLYPSTYLIPVDATPAAEAKILTDEFRKELPPDAEPRAKELGFTIPQIVTVASLVEREAQADDERALMAGVYYNRLRRGMPLEVDATIEYVFDEHHTVITKRDLEIASPYNTYRNTGLPPTPIANPGKPSLEAAFHPRPSEYLYYVAKGDGRSAFARTLSEHNANVARYLK
ncbi:MAG: endolytic transglycosylase MltG [Candidatus Velthaea sp.]